MRLLKAGEGRRGIQPVDALLDSVDFVLTHLDFHIQSQFVLLRLEDGLGVDDAHGHILRHAKVLHPLLGEFTLRLEGQDLFLELCELCEVGCVVCLLVSHRKNPPCRPRLL